jgi:hypothetical protein
VGLSCLSTILIDLASTPLSKNLNKSRSCLSNGGRILISMDKTSMLNEDSPSGRRNISDIAIGVIKKIY